MSPQPSRFDKSPIEPSGVGDDLVFGEGLRLVAIPKPLIAQILAQVYQGIRTLTRGGLEVGGLLVGPKAGGDGVVVDGIIPLPIEYGRGPSFQMSSSDLTSIVPAMESVQGDTSKAVVGFYRSRTRGDGTLRESDYEILDSIERAHLSFAADFRCCFVVGPMSESVALVRISMRNGDGWDEMPPFTLRTELFSIGTVPSSAALLQMPPSLHTERCQIDSSVSLSTVQPGDEPQVSEHRATPPAIGGWSVWRARIWLYAAACLVCAASIAGVYRWAVRKQPQSEANIPAQTNAPRAHLGFSATLEGSVWKLAWDRAAMDALNPTRWLFCQFRTAASCNRYPWCQRTSRVGASFTRRKAAILAFKCV